MALSWGAIAADAGWDVFYVVQAKAASATLFRDFGVPTRDTSVVLSDLLPGRRYHFRVAALVGETGSGVVTIMIIIIIIIIIIIMRIIIIIIIVIMIIIVMIMIMILIMIL